jgi:hypothetical protein
MVLDKRYCVEYENGDIRCFRDDGFWYTDVRRLPPILPNSGYMEVMVDTVECVTDYEQKGIIIKWIIFGVFFGVFMLWFVGGYIHAKQRLKKGLPLLGYHRVRIPLHTIISLRQNALLTQPSSSFPTPNANATAKSPKTTSPFTLNRRATTPRANNRTRNNKARRMQSHHRCTTARRRPGILRRRGRRK